VPQFIIGLFLSVAVGFSAWASLQLLDIRDRIAVIETKLGIPRHARL
jgi:hypothetical protein